MNQWAILRTRGASTLRLHRSLQAYGYTQAYTPTLIEVRKDRKTGKKAESVKAVFPGLVFIPATDLGEIAALTHEVHGMPRFSIFQHPSGNGPGLIPDNQLAPFRQAERVSILKAAPPKFKQGDTVRAPDSPYAGLDGQVIGTRGKYTLIAFSGHAFEVAVEPYQLVRAA